MNEQLLDLYYVGLEKELEYLISDSDLDESLFTPEQYELYVLEDNLVPY